MPTCTRNPPLPAAVRARLWVPARALAQRDEYARLWFALADGRVLAVRLARERLGDDRTLAPLADAFADDVAGKQFFIDDLAGVGFVQVLYAAPVLPVLKVAHAGFVFDADFRLFAAALDEDVMRLLLALEREPTPAAITRRDGEAPQPLPQPFFASVRNYNRLVSLSQPLRERRMQALARFPALLAPILFTAHRQPNLFDGKRHAWREKDEAVEHAIDEGRDLTGAIAAHYGISRGLVRAPVNAVYWHAPGQAWRRGMLTFFDALPPNQRPSLAEFERWRLYLANYFALLSETPDGDPLPQRPAVHRGAFRLGWTRTWETAARRHGDLHAALADCRDFLGAAREGARVVLRRQRVPSLTHLAASWLACHGLLGLLAASARWHRLRPGLDPKGVPPGFVLPAIVGRWEAEGNLAEELLDPPALAREGETMHHCVASYWERCVDGDRIFALRLADGERATAQYHPALAARVRDTTYRLAQLRGPHNREASAPMRAFALALELVINEPRRQPERSAALEARSGLAAARRDQRLAQGRIAALLDERSLRQLLAALSWLDEQPPAPEELLDTFIAGYAYHAGPRLESALCAGATLDLVREPDNPHDRNAVRLDWQGEKLGYLPRQENAAIAALLDAGKELVACIVTIDRHGDPWHRVRVKVQSPHAAPPSFRRGSITA